MSLICNLIGHKYTESETVEQAEENKEGTVVTTYQVKTCLRCNDTQREELRRQVKTTTNDEQEEDNDNQPRDHKYLDPNIETEKPRGNDQGIILESDDENETEEDPDHKYIAVCNNCGFSKETTIPSRSTGDYCKECGGHLEVETQVI